MVNGYIRRGGKLDISVMQYIKTVGALSSYGKTHDHHSVKCWLDENCSHEYFEKLLNDPDTTLYILEQYGYPVAMASMRICFDEDGNKIAKFGNLYCMVQGLGLGSSLMMIREQDALSAECSHLYLNVWATNVNAIAFAVKHGFEPFGFFLDTVIGQKVIKFRREVTA